MPWAARRLLKAAYIPEIWLCLEAEMTTLKLIKHLLEKLKMCEKYQHQ